MSGLLGGIGGFSKTRKTAGVTTVEMIPKTRIYASAILCLNDPEA